MGLLAPTDATEAHLGMNERGHLTIDGCDAVELAERFGAPLWVISERAIRDNVARLRGAFTRVHANTRVVYAPRRGRLLPRLEAGDVVAVLDQGTYCESVTSDYCAIPIPAAALAADGRAEITRRRETVEDAAARFEMPSWFAIRA